MPIDYLFGLGGTDRFPAPSAAPEPVEPLVTVAESSVGAGEQSEMVPLTTVFNTNQPSPEQMANTVLANLGFTPEDLEAYQQQFPDRKPLREALIEDYTARRDAGQINYGALRPSKDPHTGQTRYTGVVAFPKQARDELQAFLAQRRAGPPPSVNGGASSDKPGEVVASRQGGAMNQTEMKRAALARQLQERLGPQVESAAAATTLAMPRVGAGLGGASLPLAAGGAIASVTVGLTVDHVFKTMADKMGPLPPMTADNTSDNPQAPPVVGERPANPDAAIPADAELPKGEIAVRPKDAAPSTTDTAPTEATNQPSSPPVPHPRGAPPEGGPQNRLPDLTGPAIGTTTAAGGKKLVDATRSEAASNLTAEEQQVFAEIAAYREQMGMPEYKYNEPTGTVAQVAKLEINREPIYGHNTTLEREYLGTDNRALRKEALKEIQTKLGKLQGLRYGDSKVWFLTHAEAEALIKAHKQFGELPEKMTIYIDRITCDNCIKNLPLLAELYGVKELTVIDSHGNGLLVRPNQPTVKLNK